MPEEMVSVYRAVKRGYALVALGPHLAEAAGNFQCFNTTWPPEQHIELPSVRCCAAHSALLWGNMAALMADMLASHTQHAPATCTPAGVCAVSNLLPAASRPPACLPCAGSLPGSLLHVRLLLHAQLLRTLRHVLTVRGWWHLPRFAYGSSRGGAMTLILALRFPLQARPSLAPHTSSTCPQKLALMAACAGCGGAASVSCRQGSFPRDLSAGGVHRARACMRSQAVASLVMGMRPPEVMDADLEPVNLASGATWAFPPTLLMAASNDQEEIIELVNRTAVYLESQARS
jgi:hypothetical protein